MLLFVYSAFTPQRRRPALTQTLSTHSAWPEIFTIWSFTENIYRPLACSSLERGRGSPTTWVQGQASPLGRVTETRGELHNRKRVSLPSSVNRDNNSATSRDCRGNWRLSPRSPQPGLAGRLSVLLGRAGGLPPRPLQPSPSALPGCTWPPASGDEKGCVFLLRLHGRLGCFAHHSPPAAQLAPPPGLRFRFGGESGPRL